jgi:hypothetical protein
MKGWGLVIGLLAAVTLLALALKALPPGVLMAGVAVGGGYGAYRFSRRRKAAKENVEGRALGLEGADGDPLGLSGLPLQLLGRGKEAGGVDHVLWGNWRALDVRLFDFRYASGDAGDRRFTCSLIPLDRDFPALVIEPKTFFTPLPERGDLAAVEVEDRAFGEAFDVRAGDPAFATDLLSDDTRRWIQRLHEIAFEVHGRMLLAYMPREHRDLLALLEAGTELGRRLVVEPVRRGRTAGSMRPTASKGTAAASKRTTAASMKTTASTKRTTRRKTTTKRSPAGSKRSGPRPAPEAPA